MGRENLALSHFPHIIMRLGYRYYNQESIDMMRVILPADIGCRLMGTGKAGALMCEKEGLTGQGIFLSPERL